jgi:hypothetical protein
MYILTTDLLLLTDSDKRQTRPLVREGAPYRQDSNFQEEEISGHEPQTGLDTKTDWLTDRHSECDSDSVYNNSYIHATLQTQYSIPRITITS